MLFEQIDIGLSKLSLKIDKKSHLVRDGWDSRMEKGMEGIAEVLYGV